MFSNHSVCIQFEMEIADAPKLQNQLDGCGLPFAEESRQSMQEAVRYAEELKSGAAGFDIRGTFEITFLHDDPDLVQEIPAFEL